MKILKPIIVTPTKLVSSTVPEQDAPVWIAGTTYALGQRVQVGQRLYDGLQNGNIGHPPADSPDWWYDAAPTNRWAMFDMRVNTPTAVSESSSGGGSEISVTLNLGRVDTVALLELNAASVLVEVLESVANPSVVRSQSIGLAYRDVSSWYGYFTQPLSQRKLVVITHLPPFSGAVLRVTVRGGTEVRCGALLAGLIADVGRTRYGGNVGINDYSRKSTDEFGVTTLVPRTWSKRGNFIVELQQGEFERVFDLLASLVGQAYLAIGVEADGYGPTVIYGFTKDFSIDLALAKTNFCTLSIEGLI
jgi:hypothetical protein